MSRTQSGRGFARAAAAHAPGVEYSRTGVSARSIGNRSIGNRSRAEQERIRAIFAVTITLLYVGLLASMLYVSTGQANIGLTASRQANGQWVVTGVVPSGLSYDAGVQRGDIIEARDGMLMSNTPGAGSGETDFYGSKTLTIRKAEGDREIVVSTEGIDGGSPLMRWGFALLGLIFVGVGGPVFVKAKQRTAASAFYIFCVATASALALINAAALLHGWALALLFVNLVLWAVSFALFFFNFPVRVGRTPRQHNLLAGGVLAGGIVILVGYAWVLWGHPAVFDWLRPLGYLFVAGCVAAGLVSLSKSLRAEQSDEVRQQLALVLGGTAFAVGPTLLLAIIPTLFVGQALVRWEVTALTLGLMPMAFAYAITQNQLLGVRNFVRRGVVYLIMGFSVLLIFSLVAVFLGGAIPEGWVRSEFGLIGFGVVVFCIAISYGYLQKRVERLVDRYIYHDAYDYKVALLAFSTQLAAEQNLQVLTDQLVERTCRLMNLSCGILLLAVQPDDDNEAQSDYKIDTLMLNEVERGRDGASGDGVSEPRLQWGLYDQARTRNQKSGDSGIYLVPYTRYGDYAAWMLDGLKSELSRLGISLHQPDSSTQVLYLHDNDFSPGPDTPEVLLRTGPLTGLSSMYKSGPLAPLGEKNGHKLSEPGQGPDLDAIRSFLGVPLWTRSRFVGVLCLGGKRTGERFTRDDLSLLSTLGSQAALAIYNAQLYEAREQALLDTITALAHAIEAKDTYTITHCERITERAVALAQALALPRHEVENIRLGSILHDVGKIGIPDAVLNKPGKLTAEEYEIIKQHAQIGARIVQSVGALQGVVPIVRHHQERYDGSGYPSGLKGEEIPMGARIIAVVDAYGAMTEDRIYRKALGHSQAVLELKRWSGKQFDPVVVRTFIRLLKEQPELAEAEPHAVVSY